MFEKLFTKSGLISEIDMNRMKELLCAYVSTGFHSFLSIEQPALLDLIQFGIEVGYKYHSNIDVRELMFKRNTIATEVSKTVVRLREGATEIMKANPFSLSFVSDIWSCNITNNSYLDVTCFYIDADFSLKHQIIAFR